MTAKIALDEVRFRTQISLSSQSFTSKFGAGVAATRALRGGDTRADEPVRLIENALTQLRQNVQPALVYDYLLLRLAKAHS